MHNNIQTGFLIIINSFKEFDSSLFVIHSSLTLHLLYKQSSHLEHQSTHNPCKAGGIAGGEDSPFPFACFTLNGGNSRNTREIEENKEQEAISRERGYRSSLIIRDVVNFGNIGLHLMAETLILATFIIIPIIIRETVVVAIEHTHC